MRLQVTHFQPKLNISTSLNEINILSINVRSFLTLYLNSIQQMLYSQIKHRVNLMEQESSDLYYIRILEDGSFENVRDRSLFVEQGSTVRVILSLRNSELKPFALIKRKLDAPKKEKYDQTLKQQIYGTREVELPLKLGQAFFKKTFTFIEMQVDDQGDYFCEVRFNRVGSQFYRLIYLSKDDEIVRLGDPNYFLVQPKLRLESVTIQTILPYSMGPFENWKEQLESQIGLGYKAFHLPPVQKLGESGSYYSIADQLQFNPQIFPTQNDVKPFFDDLHKRHGTLFFVDILLNHTAFDSEWLNKPEFKNAIYNQFNTPWLNCAIELDKAIGAFSNALGNSQVTQYPYGNIIENEHHLTIIMNILEYDVIAPLKLEEYFEIDIEAVIKQLQEGLPGSMVELSSEIDDEDDDNIFIKNPRELFRDVAEKNLIGKGCSRKGVTLNLPTVKAFLREKDNYKNISAEYIRQILQTLNVKSIAEARSYIKQAINCTHGQIKYEHIELGNTKIFATPKGDSLVPRYFSELKNGVYAANNGWIQDFDSLLNFCETQDHHYFRRTIMIWGDLVKLRYGKGKQDSPALWKYMKKYVSNMARTFQGLRLDNAHSTPLHVGGYMTRKARLANENVLIFAELFTGSSQKDSMFTKQLGLNALVRETKRITDGGTLNAAMHFYSGDGRWAVGSLPNVTERFDGQLHTLLRPQYAPALVYEQSHDNSSLISSHGFKHLLPISAVVAFSKCMKGTIRGFDQYLPTQLSVVSERRPYTLPDQTMSVKQYDNYEINVQFRLDLSQPSLQVQVKGSFDGWHNGIQLFPLEGQNPDIHSYQGQLILRPGEYEYRFLVDQVWINPADKEYNERGNHVVVVGADAITIHSSLEPVRKILTEISQTIEEHYPQIYIQGHNNSVISINRFSDDFQRSRVLIAQPSFPGTFLCPIIELPGKLQSVDHIFFNEDIISFPENATQLSKAQLRIQEHHNLLHYCEIYYNYEKRVHVLKFTRLPKSLVIILTCAQDTAFNASIEKLTQINYKSNIYESLTPDDINFILFSSEQEECERTQSGLYHIPNFRKPVYGGLYGLLPAIDQAQLENNLGHPICENLRAGNWLLNHLNFRLSKLQSSSSVEFREFVKEVTDAIGNGPRYLIPYFFSLFARGVHDQISAQVESRAVPWIGKSPFFRQLGVASYQFIASLRSAQFENYRYSFSAGHPHFSVGWSRSWGRDTFISFKGCMLLTGMIEPAKEILFQFAACMRHGLIPNLIDGGRNSRFNNRDACWWFIKALKDYIDHTNDHTILQEEIRMRFLDDDMERHNKKLLQGEVKKLSIQDIVQRIVESHANGIRFREWRAGREIDRQMDSEGFNISLKLDENTGFIVGGSYRNCKMYLFMLGLTWMDKMGSSEKARNLGFPATSRDGAPIEMTALLKLALDFLHREFSHKHYKYDGVRVGVHTLTFKSWSDQIAQNFEKNYWIPKESEKFAEYNVLAKYVRQRQIYKDLAFSQKPRNDYQLRCNACIAIAVAPELFNKTHAQIHLATTEAALIEIGSLGIKTLERGATEYVPYYDNAVTINPKQQDDSDNFRTAHGFSYHNGPEWVWVYGYFLKALQAVHNVERSVLFSYLTNHKKFINESEWQLINLHHRASLPEMTNSNGNLNQFSCYAQAWSIACMLEAINDFTK